MQIETAGKSFEQLRELAEQKWEDALNVVEVEGDYDQICNIYSSLYHTMINPSIYMDYDGAYRGLDHEIHHADGFTNYTIFPCGIPIGLYIRCSIYFIHPVVRIL